MGFAAPIRAILILLLLVTLVFAAGASECAACNLSGDCCQPDGSCAQMQATNVAPVQQTAQATPILPDLCSQPAPRVFALSPEPIAALEPHVSLLNLALRI
jgi:hypothetical protein